MISKHGPRCDCCGLAVDPQGNGDCPRCGYPMADEERFLETSLRGLQRVAAYGGADVTVKQLIQRYQSRLYQLRRLNFAATSVTPTEVATVPIKTQPALVVQQVASATPIPTPAEQIPVPQPTLAIVPPAPVMATPVLQDAYSNVDADYIDAQNSIMATAVGQAPVVLAAPAAPGRVFSLRSFFADQTINIVASLGAFLILAGSLGFIASTKNLWQSFVIIFIVHALFGITGNVSYRLHSFRVVSVIYTTIFALLIPLVGFAGYRLVAGHLVHLSSPTIIAVAAVYAAITYATLAVYQRFTLFGYLAAVALGVADLAVADSLQLAYWWWPVALMALALPLLVSVAANTGIIRIFNGAGAILREPLRLLMFACVLVCGAGMLFTFLQTVGIDVMAGHSDHAERFALASMTLLLFVWFCLFSWLQQSRQWVLATPYLFLTNLLVFCYAFDLRQVGYALALIVVAWAYHLLTRFAAPLMAFSGKLKVHLETLALLVVGVLPLVVAPLLLPQVFLLAYSHQLHVFTATHDTWIEIIALVAGCALTISVLLSHTGLRRVPEMAQKAWCWLLLLSGFVFISAYNMTLLSIGGEPVWWYLGFTLAFVALTVVVRRLFSARWANPLDVLTLYGIGMTLVLGLQNVDRIIDLLLFFAILSYSVVLYQHRRNWLFLPFAFALLAATMLQLRPTVLLVACVLLPLASAGIHLLFTKRWDVESAAPAKLVLPWEWPLLAAGLVYGLLFAVREPVPVYGVLSANTVQNWLYITFPTALEMAVLSLVWYGAAALARVKWWLVASVLFAAVALLTPGNNFWVLVWLAPMLAVLALGINRLGYKGWDAPVYIIAVMTALVMGITAYNSQGHLLLFPATWALLIFAAVIYLAGVVQDEPILLWVAPCFATWSVYYSGQLGDLYRPPMVALVCASLGVGVGCLRFVWPAFSDTGQERKLLRYRLPFYATAFASAALTGIYGTLAGIDKPFPAAVPDALLAFALVAYGILIFERRPRWLALVVGFAAWGVLLADQTMMYYVAGVGLVAVLLGLFFSRIIKLAATPPVSKEHVSIVKFSWGWPWYATALLAAIQIGTWNLFHAGYVAPFYAAIPLILLVYAGMAFGVMLVERAPEILVVPAVLLAWAIGLMPWLFWQQMLAYTLLCVLIFSSQFVWRFVSPVTRGLQPATLPDLLSLGGQALVVLAIFARSGVFATSDVGLAHVGAGALAVLAGLIFWYGHTQSERSLRHWCAYGAGLLLSLVVSRELAVFGYTRIDWLTLAPATYLIVIAPFMGRDAALPQRHRMGQICSIAGAMLLLLPTLWLSFNSEDNLRQTLVLAGESLALLLVGIVTRVRFFVMSGAALVVVSAMHALFLPDLGIPPSLALAILGGALLAIATGLSLARHRLQAVWTTWD